MKERKNEDRSDTFPAARLGSPKESDKKRKEEERKREREKRPAVTAVAWSLVIARSVDWGGN